MNPSGLDPVFYTVNPLKFTIARLLESRRVSIESPSREILESARSGLEMGEKVVESLRGLCDKKTMRVWEEEIRLAAYRVEHVLDPHVSDQFLSQSNKLRVSVDLQGVKEYIDGFTQKMKRFKKLFHPFDYQQLGSFMAERPHRSFGSRTTLVDWFATKAASIFSGIKEKYIQDFDILLEHGEDDFHDGRRTRDRNRVAIMSWWVNKAASFIVNDSEYEYKVEEDDYAVPSTTEMFAENMSDMVGVTDTFCQVRDCLINVSGAYRRTFIYGMAGTGKTSLAMKLVEDPLVASTFESRIIVRMGPEYEIQNIVQAILAQLNSETDTILMEGDEDQIEYLYKIFQVRKILIVLDDVWSDVFLYLWRIISPMHACACRFLLTTRLRYLTAEPSYLMRFLNNKESWDLLRRKVFVRDACPHELERAGKQIAENCEGLPLLIIAVADLLSKAEKTPEYWAKIASSKKNSIFIDAYEKISEVLYPSYLFLPQHLKTCFLYLGAFPQNCDVRISKLINLWSAEGFEVDKTYPFIQGSVVSYFEELNSASVTLENQHNNYFRGLKVCSFHSAFWYLSKREAWKKKFLHVLDSHADASNTRYRKPTTSFCL